MPTFLLLNKSRSPFRRDRALVHATVARVCTPVYHRHAERNRKRPGEGGGECEEKRSRAKRQEGKGKEWEKHGGSKAAAAAAAAAGESSQGREAEKKEARKEGGTEERKGKPRGSVPGLSHDGGASCARYRWISRWILVAISYSHLRVTAAI